MKDIDEITPQSLHFFWALAGPRCECNLCGKLLEGNIPRLEAKVMIGAKSANFVVCSQHCRKRFLEHPGSLQYIQNTIQQIKKL